MLAEVITISGKSLMGFGSGGHYSVEHLLLTSAKNKTGLQQSADGNKIPALRQAPTLCVTLNKHHVLTKTI